MFAEWMEEVIWNSLLDWLGQEKRDYHKNAYIECLSILTAREEIVQDTMVPAAQS